MPIFPSLKIIFVHIPKTAGESVSEQLALSDRELSNWLSIPMCFLSRRIDIGKHSTMTEIVAAAGTLRFSMFTTCTVVRNPWDQVVSFYEHLRKPLYDKQYQNKLLHPYNACRSAMKLPFSDWVKLVYEDRQHQVEMARIRHPVDHFKCQTDWFCDCSEKVLVDYVLRFENLKKDFSDMGAAIQTPLELSIHRNSSKRRDYRDYYDDASMAVIGNHFRGLIEIIGYRF